MGSWTLEESALAAIRTKDVYLAAQYTRLKPRRGHKKALGAVKHSIICACWHMLSTGELYSDLGGDYFQRRDPEHEAQRLVKRLEALGHVVTLQPTSTAEEVAAARTLFSCQLPMRRARWPGCKSWFKGCAPLPRAMKMGLVRLLVATSACLWCREPVYQFDVEAPRHPKLSLRARRADSFDQAASPEHRPDLSI